ncbi:NEDD4-binding protein 2 isoform X1 [Scleropages formosus]|uniref:NEDD4 binding protein 2 n=1 Tax=Scleropages formosus TaxID=113540 RepID=A0A8C9RUQ7_SCLFO|nr:NEDD4-binding protein 2 isoform X1 [Scleropages formosus]
MPRKKRSSQSPARQSGLPSDGKAQQSEHGNVNNTTNTTTSSSGIMGGPPEAGALDRDAVVSRMQEMFSHLDPDVVYIVLAECDFKVENAMDSLLVLSEGVAPPQVSGFEMAASLLYPKPLEDTSTALPSNMSRPMHGKPEGGEDSDVIGTHLTADFDVLIDRELQTISTQQTARGSPFSSSCSLSSLPPPELLQSSTEQGHGPGQVSVDSSGSGSPVSGLSFVGGRVYKEEPGQLDFSHLTAEAVSNKPSSLDLRSYGRPSAFQAYRKSPKPNTSDGSQFMESSFEGAALPGGDRGTSLPKNSQEPPQTASSNFWNMQASEFMPHVNRPVFITPVVQNHIPWNMLPTVDWTVRGFGMQAPIKPAATIPKSWAVSAGAKPLQPSRPTRLFGQVLVLMRGAPGSGKSALARSILQQNRGGVVLSTDDYFVRDGRYCYDQSVLSEAHEWNQKRAKEAFEKGVSPIIIDNTNMQSWEMKPYVALALQYKYKVMFREPDTWWRFKPRELERRTKHGVQKEKIRRMLDHFDRHVSIDSIMCSFKKPLEPSVDAVQPSQETSLSQPSASDVRPDLVEEPHLNLESAKAHFQLFDSLPDVSSVGGCYTKEESMGDSSSSSNQTDSSSTSSQYLHLQAEGHEIGRVLELDVASTELQEGHTENWMVGNCSAAPNERGIPDDKETLQFDVKDQADEEPVAFFESISQRVRRDRGCTKQVDADENALVDDDDDLPLGHVVVEDGDVKDSDFQTTGGDSVKPELLDFVGDWPTEALEQREQRTRGEKNSQALKKGSEEQVVSDDGQIQNNCNPLVTEFQKLLDLLQVDTETSQKQMTTFVDSLPGFFDLRFNSEDLIVEAADVVREVSSVSGKEGESQRTGKDSRPELLDCVEDWTEVDATLAEDLSQKTSEERVMKTSGIIKKVDVLSLTKNNSISMPDRSEELQHGDLEVCQSSCVTTDPKSGSLAAGSALMDGTPVVAGTAGSHERRLRHSRRSGKQCKLALTFTNNSPTSPKLQLESPQLFPHLGPVSPDPVIRSSVTGMDSATQTNPQDFALLWRIDRQHQISTVDLEVKEMEGNSSRFIPKSVELVEGSGHQEVPYRVMHDKGTLVEEQELSGGNNKLENLQILSRHFKLVAFDMLEDLYDKCHQDMEWTTNLLLDSGEWFFKDDEEDDAVDKDHFTQCSWVDSHVSVKIPSSCLEVETVVSATENSTAFASFEAQCPRTESYGGLELCSGSEVTLSTSGELSNVESSAVSSRPVDPVGAAEPVIAVELGNSIPVPEEPVADCPSAEIRKSPELMGFQEKATEEQERRSENQIEKHEGCSTEEPETLAPMEEEEVAGPCLLETEYEEIGNLLFEGEVSESLLEQIMELEKKQAGDKQRERDRASQAKQQCQPVNIQTLELKLPTELALQLTELFGPVGIDPGSLSPEDCAVQIDLSLARLLHQKWKDTIHKRKRQEVLSYCLLQESSVHWGDSQSAKPGNHGKISQLLLCPDGLVSLGHSDDLPYMDHWNAFQPYVSLRDIMLEEEALQQNMEKLNRMEAQQKDSATLLKEHQLYSLFPTIDRHFLKDIFRDQNYSLERTEQFLRTLLNEEPVKTVVAPEASQHRDTESKDLPQTSKTKEPEVVQFQDTDDPEYEDFRAEAVLQRKKQQECIGKAADAYTRGMKDVASFYAQQGHLHGLKMKEANHRAAMQIFKRVNASLLPQNILDLHGLHVDEALYHLAQVLEDKTKECQNSGCRPQLSVITGRGNHSLGGVARIRPAVIDYLKSHSYRFTEPKTGLLLVTLH